MSIKNLKSKKSRKVIQLEGVVDASIAETGLILIVKKSGKRI